MLSVLLAAGLAAGTAVGASAGSNDCGCATTFREVAEAVETNYAGYIVKLPDDKSRKTYGQFRDMLMDKARSTRDPVQCRSILDAYLAFFADEHLFVTNVAVDPERKTTARRETGTRSTTAPDVPRLKVRWTPDKVEFRLRRENDLDPIEGLWRDSEGQFAIVHDDALSGGEYIAFRFRQHYTGGAGETLAIIRPGTDGSYNIHYKDANGTWQQARGLLNHETGILSFAGIGWQRTTAPAAQVTRKQGVIVAEEAPEPAAPAARDPLSPVFRELGNGLLYLSLPSFMPQYRESLQNILDTHGEKLAKSRGLVVDLRGNSGGDAIYFPLAEYFLTGPIVVSEDNAVLASDWNIKYFENFREQLGERGAFLDPVLERMRANRGKIVPYLDRRVEGPKQYQPGPARIVVLQDRGVGSAAEAFLFHMRQSDKVVTMGEPSKGNFDYQQVSMRNLGCGDFRYAFGYPLYMRSRNLPDNAIDDRGIAPDVRLAPALGDWVKFAERWLDAD